MPKVSIIVPTFNSERYIGDALASVDAQTLRDFEVIVVDDGSSDRTLEEAHAFDGCFDLTVLQQRNSGPSAARNAGIRRARGTYCSMLDADDIMLPTLLAKQSAALDADPGVGLVLTEISTFNDTGTLRERRWNIEERGDAMDRLLVENFVTTSAVMSPTQRLIDVGLFPESRRVAEDYELWLRLASRWKVAMISEALVRYRYTTGSLSSKKLYSAECALDVIETFWRQHPDMARARRRLHRLSLAAHTRNAGFAALSEANRRTALAYLATAVRYDLTSTQTWKGVMKALLPFLRSNRSAGTTDVVLVGSYPPPHGGQSVHIQSLARFLRSNRLRVDVLNTGANKQLSEGGVHSVESSSALFGALLRSPRRRLVHVHVSSPTEFGKLLPVCVAALVRRIPWIVTIHSGGTVDRVKSASSARRAATQAILRGAAKIVCVNSAIRETIVGLVGRNKVTIVAPHSVSIDRVRPPGDVTKFFEEHAPVITCTGLFEPTYGFADAVRLLPAVRARYPNAGLALIGNAEQSSSCVALITELGLMEHVKICGNLDHAACLGALQMSALFLRPTVYDGDALSVREALAMNIPVVASDTDFRPDGVVRYRRNVVGELAERVLQTLQQPPAESERRTPEDENLRQILELYIDVAGADAR